MLGFEFAFLQLYTYVRILINPQFSFIAFKICHATEEQANQKELCSGFWVDKLTLYNRFSELKSSENQTWITC